MYQDPDIDSDELASFLANPARAAAMKRQPSLPPGVDPSLMMPQPAAVGDAGSSGAPPSAAPAVNVAPPTPQPATVAAPPPAMAPVRPQPPTPPSMANDPYAAKIADLRNQISAAKPKWTDRLLGGIVGGIGMNPAVGAQVTNRKRIELGKELDPIQQQESDYKARTQKEFEDQNKVYQDSINQQKADADEKLKEAHAGRFDYLSMSPKERADQVADLEKTSGLKFTDLEKSSFILTGKVPQREQKPSLPELMKQRNDEGTAAGLKGNDLMYYKLNGKLREPNPDAEARLEDARSRHADSEADRHQREDDSNFNKSAARTAEYNKQKAAIDDRKAKAYEALESQARQKNNRTASGEVDDVTLNNRKAALKSQFDAEYASLGPPPQDRVVDRGQKQSPAAPHQNTPQASGKPQLAIGAKVSVGGKSYTVKGFNPKTGKPIVGE